MWNRRPVSFGIGGRFPIGISGRFPPESMADFLSESAAGFLSESMAGFLRTEWPNSSEYAIESPNSCGAIEAGVEGGDPLHLVIVHYGRMHSIAGGDTRHGE